MSDEPQKENTEEAPAPIQNCPYPDGFGLTIEEIKALIAKECKIFVDNDEPHLMTVTILNAFLHENEKLHKKYSDTLRTIYAEQTQSFLQEIAKSTDGITQSLQSVSVEGLHNIHVKNTAQLAVFRNTLFWVSSILLTLTIVNICVFILR